MKILPSGAEGANISGFAQPLGNNFHANIMLEYDANLIASVKSSEIIRIRKNFPESWMWNATFASE